MYRVVKDFDLSLNGITTRRVLAGNEVEVPADLAPGLLREGYIKSMERRAPSNKRRRSRSPETK